MQSQTIRILAIDDKSASLTQLNAVLAGESDLAVVLTTSQVDEALEWLQKYQCDVMLVSMTLPEGEALRLVQTVGMSGQAPKILVTDMVRDPETILYWMEEGAAGYVYAEEGWAALVKKIRALYVDEFLLCPEIAAVLIARIAQLKQLAHELDATYLMQPSVAYAELTPREQEVLQLIRQDLSNQEIAEALVIELGTVKNHVHNLLRKLDVCNRKQAAQVAHQILEAHEQMEHQSVGA